mgnify:CR=1 FL=1
MGGWQGDAVTCCCTNCVMLLCKVVDFSCRECMFMLLLLQVSSVIAQPRFGSLKQRLREVRRSRQPQKNSGGRASSIISDSTDDSNSVVSETSSVVEEKLQRLLLQVSANSQLNPSALQSGSNPNTGAFKNTTDSVATGSRAGSLYAASSSSRQGGSPLTGLSCGQASRGLGVTVRR